MQKIVFLCGISKSGKTLTSYKLAQNYDAQVFSYEDYERNMREKKDFINNEQVFKKIIADIKRVLRKGKNVIYDSFNLTRQTRQRVLNELHDFELYKIIYIMTTPVNECYKRNELGFEKENPEEVFKSSIEFEIPMEFEGFDEVVFDKLELKEDREKIAKLFNKMRFFVYKNGTSVTLEEHLLECYDKLGTLADKNLKIAGLYHDVGKLFCETHDEQNYSHYYGHANCGAYFLLSHPELIMNYGDPLTEHDVKEILFYINYHTKMKQIKTRALKDKYRRLFGDKLFERLSQLDEIDEESYVDSF